MAGSKGKVIASAVNSPSPQKPGGLELHSASGESAVTNAASLARSMFQATVCVDRQPVVIRSHLEHRLDGGVLRHRDTHRFLDYSGMPELVIVGRPAVLLNELATDSGYLSEVIDLVCDFVGGPVNGGAKARASNALETDVLLQLRFSRRGWATCRRRSFG